MTSRWHISSKQGVRSPFASAPLWSRLCYGAVRVSKRSSANDYDAVFRSRSPAFRVALLLLATIAGAHGATVTGQVTLADSREPSVRKLKDYSGVVAWLEPIGRPPAPPPPRTHTLLQKGKKFIPHILPITVGSTVDIPNRDPIFHNAFSNFAGQPFDTGLYPPGSSQRVTFRREGTARVFCNIHAAMSAVIVVLGTPHFAITGPAGAFRIENVPPGDYLLKVWHERAPEETLRRLERRIAVADPETAAGVLAISESGYLEIPHRNKYGKEYPPEPAERPGYRGGR